MQNRYRSSTLGFASRLIVGLAIAGFVPAIAAAQEVSSAQVIKGPLELPKGPGTKGFDIGRLNSENYGAFEPFYVRTTEPLSKVLQEGRVAGDTRLLVMETAAGRLALLTDQMAYHHLAQGRDGDKDWMATF
jgi:hypothetical protein